MFLNIVSLSLTAAILTFTSGFLIGKKGAMIVNIGLSSLLTVLTIYSFYKIVFLQNCFFWDFGTWFNSDFLTVRWVFIFDDLTITLAAVVATISLIVQIYSCSYMFSDPHLVRFLGLLSFFTFTMLTMLTADNLIQLFLGWEGVGLCSYLLINFWFSRTQANKSAFKALTMNRIGDSALLLAIAFFIYFLSSVDFSVIFSSVVYIQKFNICFCGLNINSITLVGFLLIIAAFAKSAQLFLHTWLPDAMEGPTPVSALLHAATMVTAGVFLIIKFSQVFELSEQCLSFIAFLGACTSLVSALIAVFQNDIKKIIAYSTCSQLGYMVTACGFSNYSGSLYHLTTHAFFKALLFLTAGAVIHGYFNEQDIRKMGGLVNIFKLSYTLFFVASLSLAGFPYLSGFFSKDFIIETSLSLGSSLGFFCLICQLLASFFTSFYSLRLIYLVFFTKNRGYNTSLNHKTHDMDLVMLFPLVFLGLCSVFVGYCLKDLFIGLGSDFLKNSIFIAPEHSTHYNVEFLNFKLKLMPFLVMFFSILVFILYSFLKVTYFTSIYNFFNRKLFFDYVYNFFITKLFFDYVFFHFYNTDKGIMEFFGPFGLSKGLEKTAWLQFKSQSGYIFHYTAHILISLVFLITLIEWVI